MTLGFPEDKAFLRGRRRAAPGVLEESISAVLGRSVASAASRRTSTSCPTSRPTTRRRGSSPRRGGSSARTAPTRPRSADAGAARRTGIRQTDRSLNEEERIDGHGQPAAHGACRCSRRWSAIQAELAEAEVEGSAGGGVVRAVVTGKQALVSVTIDPSAVDPDDVEMLQDLVTAAVNEALDASRRLAEQKMGAMQSLGGLGGLLGR